MDIKEISEKIHEGLLKVDQEIESLRIQKINEVRDKYLKEIDHLKGQLIYNVTGIIMVENISIKTFINRKGKRITHEVSLEGPSYKWIKGGGVKKSRGRNIIQNEYKIIDKSKIVKE